jgi:hypothetical protein
MRVEAQSCAGDAAHRASTSSTYIKPFPKLPPVTDLAASSDWRLDFLDPAGHDAQNYRKTCLTIVKFASAGVPTDADGIARDQSLSAGECVSADYRCGVVFAAEIGSALYCLEAKSTLHAENENLISGIAEMSPTRRSPETQRAFEPRR